MRALFRRPDLAGRMPHSIPSGPKLAGPLGVGKSPARSASHRIIPHTRARHPNRGRGQMASPPQRRFQNRLRIRFPASGKERPGHRWRDGQFEEEQTLAPVAAAMRRIFLHHLLMRDHQRNTRVKVHTTTIENFAGRQKGEMALRPRPGDAGSAFQPLSPAAARRRTV